MKKVLIILLAAALIVVMAPGAFAALSDQQKNDISKIYDQIKELQKQIVDIYQASGEITPDQAKNFKDNLDNAGKDRQDNGIVPGPGGYDCHGGAGYGMMGGQGMMGGYDAFGTGGQGMMGGYGSFGTGYQGMMGGYGYGRTL